jgi:hypothetical protein
MAISSIMDGLGGYAPYLIAVLAVIALYWRLRSSPSDPREPPLISPTIPVVGHVIGMFKHKMKYFEMIRYRLWVEILEFVLIRF